MEQLAPLAPPCFGSRSQWIEYLVAAAEEQRGDRHHGPIVLRAGDTAPAFNPRLNFCDDCTPEHQLAMQAERKCQPAWLNPIDIEHVTATAARIPEPIDRV